MLRQILIWRPLSSVTGDFENSQTYRHSPTLILLKNKFSVSGRTSVATAPDFGRFDKVSQELLPWESVRDWQWGMAEAYQAIRRKDQASITQQARLITSTQRPVGGIAIQKIQYFDEYQLFPVTVVAGICQNELAVSDSLETQEFVREFLRIGPLAFENDDLQTVVMIQMDVGTGQHLPLVVVL